MKSKKENKRQSQHNPQYAKSQYITNS